MRIVLGRVGLIIQDQRVQVEHIHQVHLPDRVAIIPEVHILLGLETLPQVTHVRITPDLEVQIVVGRILQEGQALHQIEVRTQVEEVLLAEAQEVAGLLIHLEDHQDLLGEVEALVEVADQVEEEVGNQV